MRTISTELKNRLHSIVQSKANNCDPRLRVIISREKTYFTDKTFIDEMDITEALIGYPRIEARHLRKGVNCDQIYLSDGNTIRSAGLYRMFSGGAYEWENRLTVTGADEITTAFNGWTISNGDVTEFITETEPYAFWIKGGKVYVKKLLGGQNTEEGAFEIASGASHIAAVHSMGGTDRGIVAIYSKGAGLYFRQFTDGEWHSEGVISNLPTANSILSVTASRTIDGRIAVQFTTDSHKSYEVYSGIGSVLSWGIPRRLAEDSSSDYSGGFIAYQNGEVQSLYSENDSLINKLITQHAPELTPVTADTQWSVNAALESMWTEDGHFDGISFSPATNSEVYFTIKNYAQTGDTLKIMRYSPFRDVSTLIDSGTWYAQNDNAIEQCSLSVMATGDEILRSKSTLFQPGQKVSISVAMGDSEYFHIGTAYIDEVDYDERQNTISISGRNRTGYQLSETSYGTHRTWSGLMHEIEAGMLELAGVTDYECQETEIGTTLIVPNDRRSIKTGIERMLAYGTRIMLEMPDGKIVIGEPEWIKENWLSNGTYRFEGGREVFSRSTRLNADAAYSKVCIYDDDEVLPEVYANIQHYGNWNIPANKIYYEAKPEGTETEQEMTDKAVELARQMQNVGITETFDTPFRPYLIVNDVAEIYYTSTSRTSILGLVTDVRHTFGKQGFKTQFTVDSGGAVVDGISYSRSIYGFTRQQRITDFIR